MNKKIENIVKDKEFLISFLSDSTYSSYWAKVSISDDTDMALREKSAKENECREEQWADVLLGGGSLDVYDYEEDKTHNISLKNVIKGFKKLIIAYPKAYASIMDESADFYDYDAFLQCVVFGDVIYG